MERQMDKETQYVLNDLTDVVERLAEIVRELNPGATEQMAFVDFLIVRASRTLTEVNPAANGF
jgi:hypothetical protein